MAATVLFMAACGTKEVPVPEETSPEILASEAAQASYSALYRGRVAAFLEGRVHANQMPEGYREQLLDAYSQHVDEVKAQHQGVVDVKATRAEMDTSLGVMQVFLTLTYGDDTKELIVVAMVEDHGEWKMK